MDTLTTAPTAIGIVLIGVALAALAGVGYRRSNQGSDSTRVQRRSNAVDETEALADIAEREYWARKKPAYRALALRRIRTWSAATGAVLMLGLGAWSAVGVQHAVAGAAPRGSIEWLLGWILEPVLLTGVALIVIVRSALAMVNARLSGWVWAIEIGLLSLSVAANVQALPTQPTTADFVMRLTGPIGCLLVSLVLVLVEQAVQAADIKVAAETGSRWGGVRTRLADTATGVAEKAADTLAARFTGHPADTESSAPDTGSGQTVSNAVTSTDTRLDTGADTASHPSGQGWDTASDDGLDTGSDTPSGQAQRTVFDQALDAARALGADTVDTLSVRALASRLGCGRTTAAQVRNAVLEESSADTEQEAS